LTIADSSGAVVPGAAVTAENLDTGLVREVESNDLGVARLTMLPPGVYRVRARMEGFKTFEAIYEVKAGATLQTTAMLELGAVAESIEVSAAPVMLQAESSAMSGRASRALEARRALVEQIGGTLVTVAKDVKIQVEFNPERVRRYRLVGYENRRLADEDFKNDKKDAGDLGAGHSVVALYEIVPERGRDDDDPLRFQDPEPTRRARRSGELMHVKVRYKPPTAGRSVELQFAVEDAQRAVERASENLRWAAAVAQFGMLLRDSGHKGDASWSSAAELAKGAMGEDEGGERAEFLHLLRTAAKLDGEATTSALR
jgi:hypothetical protein